MPTSKDGAAKSAASPLLLGEKKKGPGGSSFPQLLTGSANASSSLQSKRPICFSPAQG